MRIPQQGHGVGSYQPSKCSIPRQQQYRKHGAAASFAHGMLFRVYKGGALSTTWRRELCSARAALFIGSYLAAPWVALLKIVSNGGACIWRNVKRGDICARRVIAWRRIIITWQQYRQYDSARRRISISHSDAPALKKARQWQKARGRGGIIGARIRSFIIRHNGASLSLAHSAATPLPRTRAHLPRHIAHWRSAWQEHVRNNKGARA